MSVRTFDVVLAVEVGVIALAYLVGLFRGKTP